MPPRIHTSVFFLDDSAQVVTITSYMLKCYHTLLKQFKDHLHRYSWLTLPKLL